MTTTRGFPRRPSVVDPIQGCRPVRPMPAGGRQQAEAGRRGPLAGRLDS